MSLPIKGFASLAVSGFTLSEEGAMNRDCFWLTDEQFAKIEPHLPTDTRGKPRVIGG